jgi:hypothetical protein
MKHCFTTENHSKLLLQHDFKFSFLSEITHYRHVLNTTVDANRCSSSSNIPLMPVFFPHSMTTIVPLFLHNMGADIRL